MPHQTQSQSKTELVYQQIRGRVLDGRYTPGFRLVLTDLARELGVSTVPVREAVRWLEAEGLVEYTHNIGAQVSSIDLDQYRDALETLAVLEACATALAAPHLSTQDLDQAQELNEQMRRLTEPGAFDSDTYRKLNGRFHQVLVRACPNARLLAVLTSEAERVNLIRRSALRFNRATSLTSTKQHAHLLELVRTGADPQVIEHYAREHKLASMHSQLDPDVTHPG